MRHVINSLFAFLMLSLLTPQIFSSAIEPEQVKETFIIPGNLSGSTSKNIVYTRDIYGGLEISDYHRTIFLNDIGEMSPNIREDEKTQSFQGRLQAETLNRNYKFLPESL